MLMLYLPGGTRAVQMPVYSFSDPLIRTTFPELIPAEFLIMALAVMRFLLSERLKLPTFSPSLAVAKRAVILTAPPAVTFIGSALIL